MSRHQVDGDANKDAPDVDAEDVGDVYDYVLVSLPVFRVISVTRTILGRNHFHCWAPGEAEIHQERHSFAIGCISLNSQAKS